MLHRRGFERLRVAPSLSPSGGYWRCTIAPAQCFFGRDGATIDPPRSIALYQTFAGMEERPTYTSGQGPVCFEWGSCYELEAEEMADRFEKSFPCMLSVTRQPDLEYVEWFKHMLQVTHPTGLIYAQADFPLPEDYLPCGMADHVRVPFPPVPQTAIIVGDSGVVDRLWVQPLEGAAIWKLVDQDELLFGRYRGCDVVIESPFVQRRHARLSRSEAELVLDASWSVNGVELNGRLLREASPVEAGDMAVFPGGIRVWFSAGAPTER